MNERRIFRCRDVSEAWEIDAERAEMLSGPYETLVTLADVRVGPNKIVRLGVPDWFVETGPVEVPEYVYVAQRGETGPLKIGYSQDPIKRLQVLQTGCAEKLRLLAVISTSNARQLEAALHQRFQHLRLEGEWFLPDIEVFKEIERVGA